MECRTTSWTNRTRARGFTLVECLVAIAVASLVILAIMALSMYGGKAFAGLANYADLNSSSLKALDRLTRDIRQTVRLTEYSPTRLTFDEGPGKPPLVYEYVASNRTLIRQRGTETETLLSDCESLQFAIFQRTPKAGTYDQFPAATASNCKVVVVNWVCSRDLLGARSNTESVHTAKIVIRNQ